MFLQRIRQVARREVRGLVQVLAVLGIALSVLLLPQTSLAQAMSMLSFSSPPPGTPTVRLGISANAQLVAGVQAKTIVNVACGPFATIYNPATVTFSVSQTTRGAVTLAYGTLNPQVVCDNLPHTYQAVATLPAGARPFHTGLALAQLSVQQCGYLANWQYVCAQGYTSREITLR